MVEVRLSSRPGLRQQRSTIRNEAEMIDAYEKENLVSKKYTGKGEELKKRLRELGLVFSGSKSEKCTCIRLASYVYKKRIPLSEAQQTGTIIV